MALLIFVVGLVFMVVSRMTFAQRYFERDGFEEVSDEVARAGRTRPVGTRARGMNARGIGALERAT